MHADAESEPQDTRPPKKDYTFKLCFSCLLACQCGPPCPPAKDFHLALSSCRWGGWRGRHLNRARSLQAGYKRKRRHYVHACNCPLPSPIGSRIHMAVNRDAATASRALVALLPKDPHPLIQNCSRQQPAIQTWSRSGRLSTEY